MLIRRVIPVRELFSFNVWCYMEFDDGKKTSRGCGIRHGSEGSMRVY
jgi:hypothetical protein